MRRHRRVASSWRMDETYLRIGGRWHYLYRAVHKTGRSIDFCLSSHRDEITARRFLRSAIEHYGAPCTIDLDGYVANHTAVKMINRRLARTRSPAIKVWNSRCLNNIVEQDHRAIKLQLAKVNATQPFSGPPARAGSIPAKRRRDRAEDSLDDGIEKP